MQSADPRKEKNGKIEFKHPAGAAKGCVLRVRPSPPFSGTLPASSERGRFEPILRYACQASCTFLWLSGPFLGVPRSEAQYFKNATPADSKWIFYAKFLIFLEIFFQFGVLTEVSKVLIMI
jgi:hypothetical protein